MDEEAIACGRDFEVRKNPSVLEELSRVLFSARNGGSRRARSQATSPGGFFAEPVDLFVVEVGVDGIRGFQFFRQGRAR